MKEFTAKRIGKSEQNGRNDRSEGTNFFSYLFPRPFYYYYYCYYCYYCCSYYLLLLFVFSSSFQLWIIFPYCCYNFLKFNFGFRIEENNFFAGFVLFSLSIFYGWFVFPSMKMKESQNWHLLIERLTSSAQIYCVRNLKANQKQRKFPMNLGPSSNGLLIITSTINIGQWGDGFFQSDPPAFGPLLLVLSRM